MYKYVKQIAILLAIVLVIGLAGCAGEKSAESAESPESKETKTVMLEPFVPNYDQIFGFKLPFKVTPHGISEKGINHSHDYRIVGRANWEPTAPFAKKGVTITKEEAMEAVKDLFDTMEIMFGDYDRVGGKAKFDEAYEYIEKTFKDKVTDKDYAKVLGDALEFMDNNHFMAINHYPIFYNFNAPQSKNTNWHMFHKWRYYKDEAHKFMKLSAGEDGAEVYRLVVDKTQSEDSEDSKDEDSKDEETKDLALADNPGVFFRPTFDEDFKIFYRAYFYREKDFIEEIKFTDGSVSKPDWKIFYESKTEKRNLHPEITMINDVPYVAIRGSSISPDQLNRGQFLNIGKDLKGHKLAVIDLRGNHGGYDLFVRTLMHGYTGIFPDELPASFETVEVASPKRIQSVEHWDDKDNFRITNDTHIIKQGSDEVIEMPGMLVVLIDRFVASAGEISTDTFKHFSNSIVIGTPTSGTICSPAGGYWPVKNMEGFFAKIPTLQFVWDPEYFQERKGIEPDIWMDDIDIDKLTKFLNTLDIPEIEDPEESEETTTKDE